MDVKQESIEKIFKSDDKNNPIDMTHDTHLTMNNVQYRRKHDIRHKTDRKLK